MTIMGTIPPGERMTEVRVYPNLEEGPRWCAEDDRGFTGAADRLQALVATIQEWAAEEGFADELTIRLVAPAEPQPEPRIEIEQNGHLPTTVGLPSMTQVGTSLKTLIAA